VSSKAHFCDKEQISFLEDKLCTEQFNRLLEKGRKKAGILRGALVIV
jgi:hypothetical protein